MVLERDGYEHNHYCPCKTKPGIGQVWVLDICSLLCNVRITDHIPWHIIISQSSCGALSTGGPYTSWDPTSGALPPKALGQGESCVNVTTTDNWCQTVTYLDADGNPGGETIFVATSCLGGWPLSFCWQDPIYLLPGVSSNATIYNDYVIAHENYDMTQPVESTSVYLCMSGQRPFNEDNPP